MVGKIGAQLAYHATPARAYRHAIASAGVLSIRQLKHGTIILPLSHVMKSRVQLSQVISDQNLARTFHLF
jgi:hypothetical protein